MLCSRLEASVGWKGWKKSLRKVNQELHLKTNENPEKAHQKSTRRSKSIEAHSKPTQSPHQQNLNKKDYQMPTKSLHRQEPTKGSHEPPPEWHKDIMPTFTKKDSEMQNSPEAHRDYTRFPPNAHRQENQWKIAYQKPTKFLWERNLNHTKAHWRLTKTHKPTTSPIHVANVI